MKNTITFKWATVSKDENGKVYDFEKRWIYLDITVSADNEDTASELIDRFEEVLTRLLFEDDFATGSLVRCPTWEHDNCEYFDSMSFEREVGNVKYQKKEIIRRAAWAKREVLKTKNVQTVSQNHEEKI